MLRRSSVFDGKTELAPPAAERKRSSWGDILSRRSNGATDFEKNEVMSRRDNMADLLIFSDGLIHLLPLSKNCNL